MAAEDIYRLDVHMIGPQRPAQWGVYYQETLPSTFGPGPNLSLAVSFAAHILTLLKDLTSDQWMTTAFEVSKKTGDPDARMLQGVINGEGTVATPALPADNAILIQIFQSLYSKRSNGRVYIPGIAEADTVGGLLEQAYLTGPSQAFINQLALPVPEQTGTGQWELGVVSQKILNAAPPFKDWDAAFSPITGMTTSPVIARQVRRRTRRLGATG